MGLSIFSKRGPNKYTRVIILCLILFIGLKVLVFFPRSKQISNSSERLIPTKPFLNAPIHNQGAEYKLRSLSRPTLNTSLPTSNISELVTVVTAYFNLGRFQKGEDGSTFFEPSLYMHWLRVFSRIKNPVIAYFDRQQDADFFNKVRQDLPANITRIVLIKRDDLWAFGLYSQIAKIYSNPDLPRYLPNTVMPEYPSAMHAKYELLLKTIQNNPFRTKYICWLDIGLFRSLVKEPGPPFEIHLPPNFDISKVAYSEAYRPFPSKLSLEQIFLTNLVWVCGCFFIGEQTVMGNWVQEYMKYVDYFLAEGYSNSDQQVLYAMQNRGKVSSYIQTYSTDGKYDRWFYLGYLCKEK